MVPRLSLLIALLAATLPAQVTLKVPKQYATIQEAVDAAPEGATIVVGSGYYPERVLIETDGITLIGKRALVDAWGLGVAIKAVADDVSVIGFTVRAGHDGIEIDGRRAKVLRNRIEACNNRGIDVEGDDAEISRNSITLCGDDGIHYVADDHDSRTIIRQNRSTSNGRDGIDAWGGTLIVESNHCENNDDDGIILRGAGFLPLEPSEATRNVSRCNGNDAMEVVGFSLGVLIDKNRLSDSDGAGLFVHDGAGSLLTRNRCLRNNDDGILLLTDESKIDDNTCRRNGRAGIASLPDPEGGIGGNIVSGNTVTVNGRDGIRVFGADNYIEGNLIKKNFGDGLDIDTNDPGNVIEGNVIGHNRQEGIDNTGDQAEFIGNRSRNNATLDIAGAGNGLGSVKGTLAGNDFGTGGADAAQLADID